MKRRSGKIFAATLALLVCLNAMPLGALAAETTAGAPETEQTEEVESLTETDESLPKEGDGQTVGQAGDGEQEEDKTDVTTGDEETEDKTDVTTGDGETEDKTDVTTGAGETEDKTNVTTGDEETEDTTDITTDDEPEDVPDAQENGTPSKASRVAPAAGVQVLDETETVVYYVNGLDGNDTTNNGTSEDTAFATLAKAVTTAKDGDTIKLLSDITVTEQARITGKQLTITSGGDQIYTITRGEKMVTTSDRSRSWYNPAMIEATDKGTVTLQNVTLSDAGLHTCVDGNGAVIPTSYVMQAKDKNNPDDPGAKDFDNRQCVQDAMIAAYGEGASIILGDKATLKDYGGMSAVRANDGATITMQDGSVICDEAVTDRTKGKEKEETGAAGAVWLQSATFTMEQGAKITNLVGRAVYNEHGTANIDGEISDITNDKDIWNSFDGIAVHVRDSGTANLLEHSLITKINAQNETVNYASAVSLCAYDTSVTMKNGALISDVTGTAITVNGDTDAKATPDDISLNVEGEITGVTGWSALRLNGSDGLKCTIGEYADIHGNTTVYGVFYVQGSGINIDLYGQVHNNNQGIYMFANFGGQTLTMHDGAAITENDGDGVIVRRGTFTMLGGTISKNGGSGVNVETGSVFDMQGGTVSENQNAGIAFTSNKGWTTTEYPRVTLTKGTISGNTMKIDGSNPASVDLVVKTTKDPSKNDSTESAYSSVKRYMQISSSPEMVISNGNIYLQRYGITLERPAGDVKFGNTSDEAIKVIQASAQTQGWGDVLAALWVHSDSQKAALNLSKPTTMQTGMHAYLAVIPVNEEGLPEEDATVTFYGVASQSDKLLATVAGDNPNGYAVALVQPTADYGTMTITVPEQVNSTSKDAETNSYTIPGEATYTMSDSLKAMAAVETSEFTNITLTVNLDPTLSVDTKNVTLTSNILTAKEVKYSGGTLTVTCGTKTGWEEADNLVSTLKWTATLDENDFENGKTLVTTGNLSAELADTTEIYVPSTAGVTKLLTVVEVTPVDITVYMGGKEGYEGAVIENGEIKGSQSLPEPGFEVKLPDGVKVENLLFKDSTSTKTWKLQTYDGGTDSEGIYKIVPQGDKQDPLRVQFTNADNEIVISDMFDVGAAVNQTFTMEIYKGTVGAVLATDTTDPNGNSYTVISNTGKLHVRGTTGNVHYGSKIAENAQAPAGESAVKVADGTTFTINGSDVLAKADAVQLLFDDVINTTPTQQDRLIQLAQRADTVLGAPATGKVRNFTAKYLDLVDTSNGNAWVKASNKVTVCWPYPEGTDQDTEFTVLHFKDLHRDMAAGEVSGDIATSEVETMTGIVKTATHIEFQTDEFSPFALVWYTDKPAGDSKDDNEESSSSSTTIQTTQTTTASASAAAPAAAPAAVIPQTSDDSQPALWAGLLVFSGAALTALYLLKRRKQNREQ
ncbi:right-handed parallel beta-helix repeat-containing protein [Subdoligranulum variabile]|uniref:Sortase B cell surface sorting signal n=1 Tax=Subdoligranulum variabile DSM 15176 TaxID=411471 RepID=D1PS89_9FIRM|nr:right-handed parallel beta-helix repeat-containing protein [Subdoligranulum variabile]EFB74466.1 sortase B cell surface sorting signal [Subdoligranulum variabile DSM 15176]UWP69486.1 right-handed parallel beta-helix repeat-containing protein [Subdoligranulum variabile]